MMMSLGSFLFTLATLPYQSQAHSREARFAAADRVGAGRAFQFLGPGPETMSLSGVSAWGITDAAAAAEALDAIRQAGAAQPLVGGDGRVYGNYILTKFGEQKSSFEKDGTARRVEWTLELTRVDQTAAPTPARPTPSPTDRAADPLSVFSIEGALG
ncbi:MAG: phage tail protein [Pacificimonas sp.]|jgi:phage protein U|nr:phage tail protein [Pacificimonas sp.]